MHRSKHLLSFVAAALLVQGCGGNGKGELAISVDPIPDQTISGGSTASFPITIKKHGKGDAKPVTLSVAGIPDGLTFAFSDNPVTPKPTGVTSKLTITDPLGSPVAVGAYPLTISATDGTIAVYATAMLTVEATELDDFSMTPLLDATVRGGHTATFPETLTRTTTSGVAGPVTLMATVDPAGPAVEFTKNPVVPITQGIQTKLKLVTAVGGGGTYSVLLTASDGVHSHSETATLTVH